MFDRCPFVREKDINDDSGYFIWEEAALSPMISCCLWLAQKGILYTVVESCLCVMTPQFSCSFSILGLFQYFAIIIIYKRNNLTLTYF